MKNIVKKIVRYWGYEIVPKRFTDLPQANFNLLLSLLFHKISEDFFFVQVGANDGIRSDPLYHIVHMYNLRGILIEPQTDVFEDLCKNYKDTKNLAFANVAISDQDGERTMYAIKRSFRDFYNKHIPGNANGITSFYKEHIRNCLKKNVKEFIKDKDPDDYIEEIKVKTLTFESLSREYGIKNIDLLQIDAEGFDFEIIKLFDFDAYSPMVVNYESKRLNAAECKESEIFLQEKGYVLYSHGGNTCAINSKIFINWLI